MALLFCAAACIMTHPQITMETGGGLNRATDDPTAAALEPSAHRHRTRPPLPGRAGRPPEARARLVSFLPTGPGVVNIGRQ